jgi:endonuclease/exonuclease/phosphatase (EEP) superfamily protein YafD
VARVLLVVAALTGTLDLLGGLYAPLDAASAFRGHAVGVAAGSLLALLVPARGRAGVLAAGLALTVLGHAAVGLRPFAIDATAAEPGALKIVHVNTWHRLDDLSALEVYLAGTGADVVALAEVGPPKQALLARLTRFYPHQVACAERWECSLAVLSRHPIAAGGTLMPSRRNPAIAWAGIETPAGPVTVAATHVYRPTRNPVTHIDQLEGLARWIRTIPGELILAGDFNTPQGSRSLARLLAETGLAPANANLPSWPAWPVGLPQVALDHILVSRRLGGRDSGLGPAVGSDHFPLWARIARRTG